MILSHSGLPLTGFSTPDSSVVLGISNSACQRLISYPHSQQEAIKLLGEILSSKDEVRKLSHLSEVEAQTFIDILDDVCSIPSFPRRALITPPPSAPLLPDFQLSSIRFWISQLSNHGSGASV